MAQPYIETDTDFRSADDMALAHWQRFLIKVLAVTACFALAVYFWQRMPRPEILPIRQVQISGLFVHLSPAELETKATNAIRGGFLTVSVAGIKRELMQDEWISEVAVRRVWPDSLLIRVTEHEPVALWGSSGLISDEAAVFSPPQESFPPGLPFLNGPGGSEAVVLEKYGRLKTELARRGMEIDMLMLTERRAWHFRLADGPLVLLGRKDVEGRFERFFNFAIPYHAGRLLQAQSIDMRYTNGFAVNWAGGSVTSVSG